MHDVGKSAVRNIRRAAYTGIRQCDLASRMEQLDVREGSILLKKSKIERLLKSCESRCLDVFAAAMLARGDSGVRGRFCERRCGPPKRISGLETFRSSVGKDFFNGNRQKRSFPRSETGHRLT